MAGKICGNTSSERRTCPRYLHCRCTCYAELTPQQAEIVDTLKQQCPGFAQMRELVLGFRTILRRGKLATLQRWMQRASKTGIHALRTLKQDRSAVEAAVTKSWSNGPSRSAHVPKRRFTSDDYIQSSHCSGPVTSFGL
jgi:transposase